MSALTDTFRALHASGTFVIPNPWDAGSARYLEWRGFPALATTSSGFAATLGRLDRTVTLDEVLAHVEAITAAVSIPVNVDSERLYADDPAGVARSVELLASAGAAGCSIEDYNPATGRCDDVAVAAERVAAAAEAAARHGVVLTARAVGARRATLEVRESNAGARRLYERLGFYVGGRRPGYYTSPVEDALILWWDRPAVGSSDKR